MNGKGKFRVDVTREFIQECIKDSMRVPEDAVLLGLNWNSNNDSYEAVFLSEDVPETMEAEDIPQFRDLEIEGLVE